ncbi:EAL domain-containing protein [Demequina muriae]|uniref:EAL domain-containing protein n=1 Tax=Demequina muriae TaxID=3051664 RepID=A0ABT8GEN1_9MICO|nr:EAL domain-containing protein [Demequina sp. EGI L300058]MDN4479799.1 EAL domain-containing protein [Demequina sp. EGI L300058]
MTRPLTALVLTPSLGGDFFGSLIPGLAREIVAADGRLIVVETRQEHSPRDEAGEPGDFSIPVAWAEVDGLISITTAAGADHLARAHAAGKPVVLLSSTQMGDLEAPVVRPDNRHGIIAAVEHLVEHGHTRIGFVGNLAQRDIRDRFDAYREALGAQGLPADPELVFATPSNGEVGGTVAAPQVLAAPRRPTALVVGTDRNAIGLMSALADEGVRVPHDIAVVAFDNIAAGTFTSPALSSVDPRFDEVGALAGRLLLAQIQGEQVPATAVTPESAILMARESCGCDPDAQRRGEAGTDLAAEDQPRLRRRALRGALERELLTGDSEADGLATAAIDAIVNDAITLINLGDDATTAQIKAFTASLQAVTSRPDTLRGVMDAMRDYAQHAGTWVAPATAGASPVSARIAAVLWKAQASAFLRQAEQTDVAIVEQYAVDAGLLDTGGADPRDLSWLAGTSVKAGALALWDDGPSSGLLTIVGDYDGEGDGLGLTGLGTQSDRFPPEELIARASTAAREVCVVVPVSTREQDWGLLAVVVEIDPTAVRDTHQHWAALLCAALESQRRQEEVRRSALFDSLTGLPNRQLFIEHLDKAIALHARNGTPYSVLFLDLDGFKLINDSLGHQMGDRVLKRVAAELSRTCRAADTAARFGGDEFVVLLADTDADSAMEAASRVQAALDTVPVFDGHEVITRASIGIASSENGYESADAVLRDADAAMYRAKSEEPGTVAYFDAPMHDNAVRRAELAKDVLRALQEGEFEVHYQPIVNLSTGLTDRFEALVRWNHPDRGLIEPGEFLADIEETSLIIELGHWVLEEVCRQLVEWVPQVANVSINVSDKEFWSQNLLTRVLSTLERYDLPPELLTLEITEGVLMRRPEMALLIMRRLHDAGLKLHIDDFGTGYSSLETLHRFPLEAFKIDRSFIQTLTSAEESSELISSLVKLAKALGLSVVAAGVETEAQLSLLQELGCATGQGFLFMPAVTGERAGQLLGRSLHESDLV